MKRTEKIKKNIKGITLVALVVTIIVLLILAGVAINLTIGNNGLFSRAQNAVNVWRGAEVNEQAEMKNFEELYDDTLKELDNKPAMGKCTIMNQEYNFVLGTTWGQNIENFNLQAKELFGEEVFVRGKYNDIEYRGTALMYYSVEEHSTIVPSLLDKIIQGEEYYCPN